MLKNLTVGKRISLGFATILAIAIALGSTAIVQLTDIKLLAEELAEDYAPEVEIIGGLERDSRQVMYEMRGYGFTEEEEFYQKAIPWHELLNKRIKEAEELTNNSKALGELGKTIKVFKEEVSHYDELMAISRKHVSKIAELREEMSRSAADYVRDTNTYLQFQIQEMKTEFKNSKHSNKEKLEHMEKIELIYRAIQITGEVRSKNFEAQALRNPDMYEAAIKTLDTVVPLAVRLKELTDDASERELLQAIGNSRLNYKKAMELFLEEWKALQAAGKELTDTGTQVVSKAEEVARAGIKETSLIAHEAMHISNFSNTILVWGLVLAVLIGMILSYILVKTITAPIIRISDSLHEASDQVASASGQLSTSSQQLSSASSEQASSIEETSSSLEEITGMVSNNVDNARNCRALAEEVRVTSGLGNESMEQLIESMKEILNSNEKIQDLVKVIGEIGEKTAIIDEIVFQTKLLSFNASVEAERAGEHGRGFAVVAQEVGNLAQMSGKAATEISSIVKASIKNAEAITQDNKSKVESGNKVVVETAKTLKDIVEKSDTVLQSLGQILSASQDQASGIAQINNAISQLDKVTQENAATAEESASASEELSSQAEALNGMVADLTVLVTGKNVEHVKTRGSKRAKARGVEKRVNHVSKEHVAVPKIIIKEEVLDDEWEQL